MGEREPPQNRGAPRVSWVGTQRRAWVARGRRCRGSRDGRAPQPDHSCDPDGCPRLQSRSGKTLPPGPLDLAGMLTPCTPSHRWPAGPGPDAGGRRCARVVPPAPLGKRRVDAGLNAQAQLPGRCNAGSEDRRVPPAPLLGQRSGGSGVSLGVGKQLPPGGFLRS